MGPPGAGKGTQAKRLVEKFDMAHLSSGDIFRAEKAGGSDLGKELARYMTAGQLVPDDIVVKIMTRAVTTGGAPGGLLLDGFPRTVAQAEALDAQLDQARKPLDAVVVIVAEDEDIVARITGRRTCGQCGEAYHVTFLPPKTDNRCDACGSQLSQREDDTESVVRERLSAYTRQTEPVIEYYRGRENLLVIDVDGGHPPDDVAAAMVSALDQLKTVG